MMVDLLRLLLLHPSIEGVQQQQAGLPWLLQAVANAPNEIRHLAICNRLQQASDPLLQDFVM